MADAFLTSFDWPGILFPYMGRPPVRARDRVATSLLDLSTLRKLAPAAKTAISTQSFVPSFTRMADGLQLVVPGGAAHNDRGMPRWKASLVMSTRR